MDTECRRRRAATGGRAGQTWGDGVEGRCTAVRFGCLPAAMAGLGGATGGAPSLNGLVVKAHCHSHSVTAALVAPCKRG